MADGILSQDITAYYAQGREQARLTNGVPIEMVRTQELILRHAPPPPAVVYDIGGGTGPYAFWLAEQGYAVHLQDAMPLHIEQATALASAHAPLASISVGDARHLDLPDSSADMVLLLGPLYHLTEREERVQALREAYRLLRVGGIVLAAAISRYATLLDGLNRGFFEDPTFVEIVRSDLATGQHRNQMPDAHYFTTAYLHRPEELQQESPDAGFQDATLYAIEGPHSIQEHWDDLVLRERHLEALRWIECDPLLMAVSSHILVVGHKEH